MSILERFKSKKEEPERGRTQEEREAYFKSKEFKKPGEEAVERAIEKQRKEHEITPEKRKQLEDKLVKIQEGIDQETAKAKRAREESDKYHLQAFEFQPHLKGVRPDSFEGKELLSSKRELEMFSRQADERKGAIEAKVRELEIERTRIKEQLGSRK